MVGETLDDTYGGLRSLFMMETNMKIDKVIFEQQLNGIYVKKGAIKVVQKGSLIGSTFIVDEIRYDHFNDELRVKRWIPQMNVFEEHRI